MEEEEVKESYREAMQRQRGGGKREMEQKGGWLGEGDGLRESDCV